MKKKSILLAATAVMLVAAMSIGGMLAYFTDTDTKTNTFTVGNVDITLEEPKWDADVEHVLMPGTTFAKDPTVKNVGSESAYMFLTIDLNKYVSLLNLMGVDAAHDEAIAGYTEHTSLASFVQAIAADNDLRAQILGKWFGDINHSDWKVMNVDEITAAIAAAATQTNPSHLKVVLGYIGTENDQLAPGASVQFMSSFGIPGSVTQEMMTGDLAYHSNFNTVATDFQMTFTASAIQAAEIDGIDAAYANLFPNGAYTEF